MKRLIDATGLKHIATELFSYGYRLYFSRLDSICSICIKAVASKIMHSGFSINASLPSDMLLS